MNVNYLKIMEKTLSDIEADGRKKSMLLHSCCAPCSTHVIKVLQKAFDLTVFYFNPNIYPNEEYEKRLGEQKRLGHEDDSEGGLRCRICCALRLEETAKKAAELGKEYFTTTLSVSPLKNAAMLNEIGQALEKKYGVKYFVADFKKRDGYLDSVRTSKELGIYRQHYCGCRFSLSKLPE